MSHRMSSVIPAIALITVLVLSGCGGTNGQGTDGTAPDAKPMDVAPAGDVGAAPATRDSACTADSDCVPAECCHPRTCTHKDSAPDCGEMMCTMDCRGGTMDCGGGRCLCDGGKCAAEIFPPKKPKILSDPPPPPGPE